MNGFLGACCHPRPPLRAIGLSAELLAVQLLDLERAGDTPFADANTGGVQENATLEMFMSAASWRTGVATLDLRSAINARPPPAASAN